MTMCDKEKTFLPDTYRLAAFDLDGTLLCGREPMHRAVREALLALKQKGVTVAASSGRNMTQLTKRQLSRFRYAVLSNGACTLDTVSGSLLFSHPIERIIALFAIDRILKMGGTCFAQQGNTMISPLGPLRVILKERQKYALLKRLPSACALISIYYGKSVICTDPLEAAQKSNAPFYKLQAFFPNAETAERSADRLRAETGLEVLFMQDGTLELTAPGVSKANALAELAEHLGFTEAHIAAFGDSMNDAEMLTRAGFSVAMRNGDERLFPLADRIAPPVGQDGAAQMIRELWQL